MVIKRIIKRRLKKGSEIMNNDLIINVLIICLWIAGYFGFRILMTIFQKGIDKRNKKKEERVKGLMMNEKIESLNVKDGDLTEDEYQEYMEFFDKYNYGGD